MNTTNPVVLVALLLTLSACGDQQSPADMAPHEEVQSEQSTTTDNDGQSASAAPNIEDARLNDEFPDADPNTSVESDEEDPARDTKIAALEQEAVDLLADSDDEYSDHPSAWTTKSGDSKDPEWLEVGFTKPVRATAIRIRQTAAPGAISKVELIDTTGATHEIWSGTDDRSYEKNAIGWFNKDFPQTPYQVKAARITLATARVWGWNEIDAVQLVGE